MNRHATRSLPSVLEQRDRDEQVFGAGVGMGGQDGLLQISLRQIHEVFSERIRTDRQRILCQLTGLDESVGGVAYAVGDWKRVDAQLPRSGGFARSEGLAWTGDLRNFDPRDGFTRCLGVRTDLRERDQQ